MKQCDLNNALTRVHQLPPHAYHPNPSMRLNHRGYIARPEKDKKTTMGDNPNGLPPTVVDVISMLDR